MQNELESMELNGNICLFHLIVVEKSQILLSFLHVQHGLYVENWMNEYLCPFDFLQGESLLPITRYYSANEC